MNQYSNNYYGNSGRADDWMDSNRKYDNNHLYRNNNRDDISATPAAAVLGFVAIIGGLVYALFFCPLQ